jgi:hypothetical protein
MEEERGVTHSYERSVWEALKEGQFMGWSNQEGVSYFSLEAAPTFGYTSRCHTLHPENLGSGIFYDIGILLHHCMES